MRRAVQELRGGLDAVLGRGPGFTAQGPGTRVDPDGLAGYFCEFAHKTRPDALGHDGLPVDPVTRAPAHWVIPVAQAALGYWERRLAGEPVDAQFLALADWLLEHAAEGRAGLGWPIDLAVPKYGLAAGWTSAMGQGEAISVLLRAHRLTGDNRYRATAEAALRPLTVPVEAGGLQRPFLGATVLEEYPATRPVAVLNGWMFALFGLWELGRAGGRSDARALFERSAAGLTALLPRYDAGWWSRYSLYPHGRPDLAKPFYQRLHPVLLDALHRLRPDPALPAMAERWRRQITPLALARVSVNKAAFRIYRATRSPGDPSSSS